MDLPAVDYEALAAVLYDAYRRNSVDVEQQPWDELYADEQLPWIAVAKEAWIAVSVPAKYLLQPRLKG